ncbi:pyridoxamine 5'-phosphate oxidase family protein [Haloarcula amylovorans]|uniref:pyridoxamine 5'-phosphate oxidase family protein n=1 Tax=Haloarcula amylovorans TaxID=2562280 RepID=UPI0010763060|nr:pyridoxamine 5'-phosphate oxidase family protein [Halomicroarcula amylolytica]
MSTDDSVEMDEADVDAFLDNGGTGVLSLSTDADEAPHTVPVSYGYDAETRTFYFRLSVGAKRSKPDLADHPVSFVVHREEDDRWRSVVANGRLEGVEESGIETETLDGLDRVEIPLVDIFDEPTRVVPFEFYRLVPDNLTGRAESPRGV